jgi:predicted outer membrane repeat protein
VVIVHAWGVTRRIVLTTACVGALILLGGGSARADQVVGHGTPASCTSSRVLAAVRRGGVIRFACGPAPVTIRMRATAKVRNRSRRVVIDGGGLVTLSGQGRRRILYLDTCDPQQEFTTSHCQDQANPELTIERLTLTEGNSTGQQFDGGGGGAIFDRGGRLRILDSTFTHNRCDATGPDIGGGAVRALSQYDSLPVEVIDSHFSDNVCSNGGALSSIGVSWTIADSTFTADRAIGHGANPARSGTPGGGSGGAIYNDGDEMKLRISSSTFTHNHANEGGGAIFFVSDDRTGTLSIINSDLSDNVNEGFQTQGLPGVFFLGAHRPSIVDSRLH